MFAFHTSVHGKSTCRFRAHRLSRASYLWTALHFQDHAQITSFILMRTKLLNHIQQNLHQLFEMEWFQEFTQIKDLNQIFRNYYKVI